MLSRNGTVGQTNHMLAEMHVALLLGQKGKEVVSPVFQCGARTGLFLFWVLDVCVYNVWALWVCLLVTVSAWTAVVRLHVLH